MEKALNITKALSEGNRMRVIIALTTHDELCVCQITEILGLAMATVSRHMSILQNAALVKGRKEGRWMYYRLSDTFPPLLLQWLRNSLCNANEIKKDEKMLKKIVSCGRDELRKTQRQRKTCGT